MGKTQYYLNNGASSLICDIPDENPKYLLKKNYLSEFKTDADKEEARNNLGITDIISKIQQSISDVDLDIAKLVKDVDYENNALTLTFYDDSISEPINLDFDKLVKNITYGDNALVLTFYDGTKSEPISLADLAIDGMLSDVMYIKEDDDKPEDFPLDYTDGYPCYYFQWNIGEAGLTTKKVIVVPTNDFIDIRFDYSTSGKNYGVRKNEDNLLFVNVPWIKYNAGSNITIDNNNNISAVVPTYNAGSNITIDNNNINSVVPMKSITPTDGIITLEDGTYYIYGENELNELIILLPYISKVTNAHGLAILFTSGDAPSITYQIKDSADGDYHNYDPKHAIGFLIESNSTYEMTCTYVNSAWYISAIPFDS